MFPYTNWLNAEKQQEGPGRGGDRPGRHRQLHAQARAARRRRGIAANVLWTRAEELKKEQDWDRMKATVDLITKLQPHFLSVWTFQGWNLAYNVSVEWDAPEDKYEWIKKGIKFLQDGVEEEPAVARPDLGHRLDLLPQARLLRRVDHPPPALPRRRRRGRSRPTSTPRPAPTVVGNDNFQLGYGWFSRAVDLVDEGGHAAQRPATEANLELRRPVPPAQGPARRPRLPLDARPRPDPLRRRPGEDEHRWASPPPSARSPRTSGPRRSTSGSSSARYEFMTHNEVSSTAS